MARREKLGSVAPKAVELPPPVITVRERPTITIDRSSYTDEPDPLQGLSWDDIEKRSARVIIPPSRPPVLLLAGVDVDKCCAMLNAVAALSPERKQVITDMANARMHAMLHGVAVTLYGKLVPEGEWRSDVRRCICCGGIASEVQHDS